MGRDLPVINLSRETFKRHACTHRENNYGCTIVSCGCKIVTHKVEHWFVYSTIQAVQIIMLHKTTKIISTMMYELRFLYQIFHSLLLLNE